MSIKEAFKEILMNTHFWNWAPDWQIAKDVYEAFPDSYSILTPFAFSYLEELIRSMTTEYGIVLFDENGNPKNRKVGYKLVDLAIKENKSKDPDLIQILDEVKEYYKPSSRSDKGDNRHSVSHGYMHSRFWSQDSFEKLIIDLARLSKYSGF